MKYNGHIFAIIHRNIAFVFDVTSHLLDIPTFDVYLSFLIFLHVEIEQWTIVLFSCTMVLSPFSPFFSKLNTVNGP